MGVVQENSILPLTRKNPISLPRYALHLYPDIPFTPRRHPLPSPGAFPLDTASLTANRPPRRPLPNTRPVFPSFPQNHHFPPNPPPTRRRLGCGVGCQKLCVSVRENSGFSEKGIMGFLQNKKGIMGFLQKGNMGFLTICRF